MSGGEKGPIINVIIFGNQETKVEQHMRETMEMVDLKEQGMTYKQIGNMYGLTRATVYTRLKKYTGRVEICCR